MNTEMINDLVKESLNPYVVIRLVVNHTKEEMDVLEQKLIDIVGAEELEEIYKPAIIVETSDTEGYIFAPKTVIPKFANLLDITRNLVELSSIPISNWNGELSSIVK